MKYIFLDIDGVMLPITRWAADKAKEFPLETLTNLQMLTDSVPDCEIVISSDWRLFATIDELRSAFPEDMRELIRDVTPILDYTEGDNATKRDREIASYINQMDLDPEDCVALEDSWTITCIPVVMCKPSEGLTKDDAIEAFEYLSGQRPFYDIHEEVVPLLEF